MRNVNQKGYRMHPYNYFGTYIYIEKKLVARNTFFGEASPKILLSSKFSPRVIRKDLRIKCPIERTSRISCAI